MSVVGISPTDIINGIKAVNKAVSSLKRDGGARDQYQSAKQSRDDMHGAVKSLSEACNSSSIPSASNLQRVLEPLLSRHERWEKRVHKYENALGESSSSAKRRGIPRKLQWTFNGSEDVKELDISSRPAIDAAVLQTLHFQNEAINSNTAAITRSIFDTGSSTVNAVQIGLSGIADQVGNLADDIMSEQKQQSREVLNALSSMTQQQEETIVRTLINSIRQSAILASRPTQHARKSLHGLSRLTPEQRQRRALVSNRRSTNQRKRTSCSNVAMPGAFPIEQRLRGPCTSMGDLAGSYLKDHDSALANRGSHVFWALLLTVLYANPQPRRLAARLLIGPPSDPILALMYLVCAILVRQYFFRIPKQINSLSDSGIIFEDAFGVELQVPYQLCEQFEIFHGFLEHHFRQRPGLERVIQKDYRILLGTARGQAVEPSNWTVMVRPRARLTMAMLLLSAERKCAKCSSKLKLCMKGPVYNCNTCKQDYSVENLKADDRKIHSTEVSHRVASDMQIPDSLPFTVEDSISRERRASAKSRMKSDDVAHAKRFGSRGKAGEYRRGVAEQELSLYKNMVLLLMIQAKSSQQSERDMRPRTLAILQRIGCPEAIDAFVEEQLSDIHLPYTSENLPRVITGLARKEFLRCQHQFPTDSKHFEVSRRHQYIDGNADSLFFVKEKLGVGGFGVVDRVVSRLSLRDYARKRIARGGTFLRDNYAVRRFNIELNSLKHLSHRHIVKLIGSYTDNEYFGILMTPVAQMDLNMYLSLPQNDSHGREHRLRRFYGCLATAVEYLHEQQVRHQDIKPKNCLVKDGEIYLADFGISKRWVADGGVTWHKWFEVPGLEDDVVTILTQAFSKAYCAPELCLHHARNSFSDIWSLGCVFFDMATVVAGYTLADKITFFQSNGTRGLYIRDNKVAAELWAEELKRKTPCPEDSQILELILSMCQEEPHQRPTATEVVGEILDFDGPPLYFGFCCDRYHKDGYESDTTTWSNGYESDIQTGPDGRDLDNVSKDHELASATTGLGSSSSTTTHHHQGRKVKNGIDGLENDSGLNKLLGAYLGSGL